jgi:hypothetical protein
MAFDQQWGDSRFERLRQRWARKSDRLCRLEENRLPTKVMQILSEAE